MSVFILSSSGMNSWKTTRVRKSTHSTSCRSKQKGLLIYCVASELTTAAVCHLRVTNKDTSMSTGFVLGKAKVAPVSGLELCAAVLAVEVA